MSTVQSSNAPPTTPVPLAASLAGALQRRGLATPALLYLAGHRPLAFAAGQLLAVAAPLAAVLGAGGVMDWARLLSAPEGVDQLQAALHNAAEEPAP
jgi:hypothetical protein